MKKFLFIFLFIIGGLSIYGQTKVISGRVIDEQGQAIPYVNVVLLNKADSAFISGTVTGEDGVFRLEASNPSQQMLKYSSVGYAECFSAAQDTSLVLPQAAYAIGEVSVSGARPVYRMQGQNFVTDVSNSLLQNIGTANDVLKQLPGVITTETDGEYEVFGKGAATIYINNKEVRDPTELERLSSEDITSVELINNPGANYDADVRAVLKIKTKRKIEGFASTIRLRGTQNHCFSDMEQVDMSYARNKWTWYANLSHNAPRSQVDGRNKMTFHTADKDYNLTMDMMDWDARSRYATLASGAGFQVNPQNEIGASYTYNYSKVVYKGDDNEVLRTGNEVIDELANYSHSDDKYNQHAVNLYYVGKLGEKLDVNLNADYINRDARSWQRVDESGLNDVRTVTSTNNSLYNLYAAKLELTYPLGPGSLSGGFDFSYMDYDQDYDNEENVLTDAFFHSEERKLAGFLNYSAKTGPLTWSAGLRYEQFRTRYYENSLDEPTVKQTYKELFPTASVSMPIDKVNLSLVYSKRTSRPTFYQLRNGIEYTSRFLYSQGNPYLRPTQIHDLSLNIGYRFLQMTLGYYRTKDQIVSTDEIVEGADPITMLMKNKNVPRFEEISAMLTFQHKIGIWNPTWTAGVYKSFFHLYDFQGNRRNMDNPYGYFAINNMFSLPKGFVLNVDANCITAGNSGEMFMKTTGSVDLALRKSFLDGKLELNLQVNDLFATAERKYIAYSEHIDYDRWNFNDTRMVRLTIVYKFHNYSKKYKGYNSASEEMNRM